MIMLHHIVRFNSTVVIQCTVYSITDNEYSVSLVRITHACEGRLCYVIYHTPVPVSVVSGSHWFVYLLRRHVLFLATLRTCRDM